MNMDCRDVEARLSWYLDGEAPELGPHLEGCAACREKLERLREADVLLKAAARTFLRLNPGSTFAFVSGAGTDSSERGRTMWARVKGAAENALLAMPFRTAYMFRPAAIQPLHGIRSRTRSYRIFYAALAPILPLLLRLFPQYVTTTERLGRAMIEAAKHGAPKRILESADINALAAVSETSERQ